MITNMDILTKANGEVLLVDDIVTSMLLFLWSVESFGTGEQLLFLSFFR